MTNLVNLTPHEITFKCGNLFLSVPNAGTEIRVDATIGEYLVEYDATVEDRAVPVFGRDMMGEPYVSNGEDLEEFVGTFPANILFVVSMVAGEAILEHFPDIAHRFVTPGTGPKDEAIRDEGKKGKIVAVTRLKAVDR